MPLAPILAAPRPRLDTFLNGKMGRFRVGSRDGHSASLEVRYLQTTLGLRYTEGADAKIDKPPLSGPGEMLVQQGQGRLM